MNVKTRRRHFLSTRSLKSSLEGILQNKVVNGVHRVLLPVHIFFFSTSNIDKAITCTFQLKLLLLVGFTFILRLSRYVYLRVYFTPSNIRSACSLRLTINVFLLSATILLPFIISLQLKLQNHEEREVYWELCQDITRFSNSSNFI